MNVSRLVEIFYLFWVQAKTGGRKVKTLLIDVNGKFFWAYTVSRVASASLRCLQEAFAVDATCFHQVSAVETAIPSNTC